MIVRNPILRATWVVYTTWYVIAYLVASIWLGQPPWLIVEGYPLSLVVIGIGAGLGLAATFGLHALHMDRSERRVKAGTHDGAVHLTLGAMPEVQTVARDTKAAQSWIALMHKQQWWPHVVAFPAHMRAMEALLAVMATEPDLPASPVPGGHAGLSLIVHSLAVAGNMLREGRDWRYTGQYYKNGRLRVPLRDTQGKYHRFRASDLGLLALAGLAHDIGKLVCYQPTDKPEGWDRDTLPVKEVAPNHDIEGAGLLRRLPEVMALPYADRRALLVAVGTYHHPAAMTIDGSLADRMRSLTELLAQADMNVGYAEGEQPPPEAPAEDEPEAEPTDAVGPASLGNLAPELAVLMRMLEQPGAIGAGPGTGHRIGYKYDSHLWLSDTQVRSRVSEENGASELMAYDALDTNNGNATAWTKKLLTQLAEKGWLVHTFRDQELAPSRALYVVRQKGQESTRSGVFVLNQIPLPSIVHQADDKPMEIVRPLWGERSGHAPAAAPEPTPTPTESPETPETPKTPEPSVEPDEQAAPKMPPAAPPEPPAESLELSLAQEPTLTRHDWDAFLANLLAQHEQLRRVPSPDGSGLLVKVTEADHPKLYEAVELMLPAVVGLRQGVDYEHSDGRYILTVPSKAH